MGEQTKKIKEGSIDQSQPIKKSSDQSGGKKEGPETGKSGTGIGSRMNKS